MKIKHHGVRFAVFTLCLLAGAAGAQPQTPQDALWARLAGLNDRIASDRKQEIATPTAQLLQIRQLALEFYERFPADFRTPYLREAFLAYQEDDPVASVRNAVRAVASRLKHEANGDWDLGARVRSLQQLGEDTALDPQTAADRIRGEFNLLRVSARDIHPPPAQMRPLFLQLQASPNATLRELSTATLRFLQLYEAPIELRLPRFHGGGTLDLAQLRGKAVLVDLWHQNCASCIAAMPDFQNMYGTYKSQGLEIVGVFIAGGSAKGLEDDRKVALQILDKQGATWPETIVMRDSAGETELSRAYGCMGAPQWWLFDRDGRLVLDAGHRDLRSGRAGQSKLEMEIRRVLGIDKP